LNKQKQTKQFTNFEIKNWDDNKCRPRPAKVETGEAQSQRQGALIKYRKVLLIGINFLWLACQFKTWRLFLQ